MLMSIPGHLVYKYLMWQKATPGYLLLTICPCWPYLHNVVYKYLLKHKTRD